MALFDRHHEFRAKQAADADEGLHAGYKIEERAVVIRTVMPRATRPHGVALWSQELGLEEVLLYDLYPIVESFEFQSVDQPHRVSVGITRKYDLPSVEGDWIAFYGYNTVASGGEGEHELAITRADDCDRGVSGGAVLQRGEELGEEREGVFP